MTPQAVFVRSGRNPHEVSLAVALLLVALYSLFREPPSTAIDAGMSDLQRYAWGAQELLGSSLTLLGLYLRPAYVGLLIERVGQLLLGTGAFTYAVVLLDVSTFSSGGLVLMVSLSIGIACLWRVWQVTRDAEKWRRAFAQAEDE